MHPMVYSLLDYSFQHSYRSTGEHGGRQKEHNNRIDQVNLPFYRECSRLEVHPTKNREKKMKTVLVLIITALLAAAPAMAQERPTADEAKKVMNYYFYGKGGGTILLEHTLCNKMGEEKSSDKNTCLEKADPATIQKGQKADLWMNYMVPLNDNADILISFSRDGKVRQTETVKLAGATRYRTWKRIPTTKAGQWSVSITQELADSDLELGAFQYTVEEPKQ